MGEVYRAQDTRLGRTVALKLLPAEFANDASRRERFEHEARTVAALNHPNILALFDIGNENGVSYLVTEFVDGETLRSARLPFRKTIVVAAQIADGLAAAHSAGVTHRDIKPDNIMVAGDGRVRILDFGLAKTSFPAVAEEQATAKHTEPGIVMGTIGYMSPEQVSGASVDHRSDIFSFGAVLYELISGERAFQRNTAVGEMHAILNEDPPELPESAPAGLRDVVSHCLEKKPAQRFQSAQDLAFALRALSRRSSDEIEARPPATPETESKRVPLWVAAAMIIFSIILGALATLRWFPATHPAFDSIRLTRFASELGDEQNPEFSPDGHAVLYQRSLPTTREIVVQPLDSPTPVTLVSSPRLTLIKLLWTADGTRVCYHVLLELWCVGAAGGKPERLLENVGPAAFIGQGESLIFGRLLSANRRQLFVSSPPGAEAKAIEGLALPESVGTPQLDVSPDKTKLLVVTSNPGAATGDAWVIPYPSGTPKKLPNPSGTQIAAARWYPDSRHFVEIEVNGATSSYGVAIADTQSDNRHVVVPNTGTITSIAVSPDGNRILYSTGQPDQDLLEYSIEGKRLRELAASPNREINPTWSPSGNLFLYIVVDVSGRHPAWWVGHTDGSNATLLSAHALSGWPTYSPDGRRIAYSTSPLVSATPGIEVMPSEGGRPVRIVSSQAGAIVCWSADGEWVWYSQASKLWKVPSQGGQAISLPGGGNLVDCSPDGRWIAYRFADGLHLVGPDGTQDHLLTAFSDYTTTFRLGSFDHTGSLMYLLRNNCRAMDVMDIATSKIVRKIDFDLPAADCISWFSIHPDGKRILLETGGSRLDLWMAEGFAQPTTGWKSLFAHW
jgi:serine/threonine protein kinase/WD40 repeat protein